MSPDTPIKLAIYQATAETGFPPTLETVAARTGVNPADVRAAFARLAVNRLLVLEPDGVTIRMAPPFSGVPTQHQVLIEGTRYYANCAWDALGIAAALHRPAVVHSRCEQSRAPLRLAVSTEGPEPSPWLFHCLVPAARWWQDIVFT